MLGKALAAMTDAELRRVLDAPVETWGVGELYDAETHKACLLGHADAMHRRKGKDVLSESLRLRLLAAVPWKKSKRATGDQFDALCYRFGIPRVVRAIKVRALAELEARTQRDPATVGAA